MNERIRDLLPNPFAVDYQYKDGPLDLYTEKEMFRYAELIVRECAQRCEDIGIKHQVEETTYAAGKKAGAFECATDLKQHFGVEE